MSLHTSGGSGPTPDEVFTQIRSVAQGTRSGAQRFLTALQNSSVDTLLVFSILDAAKGFILNMNTWKTVAGLDAYATSQGYSGTLTSDMTACVAAAQACIDWVVANFPTSGGFMQAFSLNVDGSRAPRSFTPAQTAGLQSALTAFMATIS